jgi:predicted DsbA family dithiol-disulfide isomerase
VRVQWTPFFLDPTVPPEGRHREPRTRPGDPPTPLELRGERLGLTFTRGRTFQPNSHLALQVAMYAQDHGIDDEPLHRALYRAHFETLENIGDLEVLVRIGAENGLDAAGLREALETGQYAQEVDHAIAWAHTVGITGVPTFIFNERYAIVGAQEYPAFQRVMEHLGYPPPPGAEPPPEGVRVDFPDE